MSFLHIDLILTCETVVNKLQSVIYYIDNTAHLPNLEKPLGFNQIVQSILDEYR